MLPQWLSSWYQAKPQQEPSFNDQYTVDLGEEWVQILTPSAKQQQPPPNENNDNDDQTLSGGNDPTPDQLMTNNKNVNNITTNTNAHNAVGSPASTVIVTPTNEPIIKGLSRQERRANARFAAKEKNKQARTAALVSARIRGKGLNASCLPTVSLSIES